MSNQPRRYKVLSKVSFKGLLKSLETKFMERPTFYMSQNEIETFPTFNMQNIANRSSFVVDEVNMNVDFKVSRPTLNPDFYSSLFKGNALSPYNHRVKVTLEIIEELPND